MSEVKEAVREFYGRVANTESSCCAPSCCAPEAVEPSRPAKDISLQLGYTDQEIESVPPGANLGLGCGNPQAIANLRPKETVIDLGSGAGFDCLLAANRVGPEGRVIGVDMTPQMLTKARANAEKAGAHNVEFRLGEIENLPVADKTADVILSNCVINLSEDKLEVYKEAYRVLKPGGRLAISDVVALKPLPEEVRRNIELFAGCIAGAATVTEVEAMLKEAGFVDIRVAPKVESSKFIKDWLPDSKIEEYVASATVEARRP